VAHALVDTMAFERHMLSIHGAQFGSVSALWDHISELVTPAWQASYSTDGTLECTHCESNFISRGFLCRHHFMMHSGQTIGVAECHKHSDPVKLGSLSPHHVVDYHTQPCSVSLSASSQVLPTVTNLQSSQSLPGPSDTRNPRALAPSNQSLAPFGVNYRKRKCQPSVTKTTNVVVISDDDSDDAGVSSDKVEKHDDNPVVSKRARPSCRTVVRKKRASVDEVNEVIESIIVANPVTPDLTNESLGVSQVLPSTVLPAFLPDSISEEENEIIESIVPSLQLRCNQQPSRSEPDLVISIDDDDTDDDVIECDVVTRKPQANSSGTTVHSCKTLVPSRQPRNTSITTAAKLPLCRTMLTSLPDSTSLTMSTATQLTVSLVPATTVTEEHVSNMLHPSPEPPVNVDTNVLMRSHISNVNIEATTSPDASTSSCHTSAAGSVPAVQQLMTRNSISFDNVEEVLEIDGETVLIVHGDDDDNDDDDE
jgi:hypothetical protein